MAARRSKEAEDGVKMVDIASRCGVSLAAVSYALAGDSCRVSETTRSRILSTAREMGYDPSRNQAARRMAMQRHGSAVENKAIGFALPLGFGRSTYHAQIQDGALGVMSEHGYGLHVVSLRDFADPLPMACRTGEIDGLMSVQGAQWFALWVRMLRKEPNFGKRPIVGLVDPLPGCSSVHADDYEGGYSAASHLLELGHRHILHGFDVAGPARDGAVVRPTNVASRRLQGLSQAYKDNGLDADELAHMLALPSGDPTDELAEPMMGYLAEHPEITAIVAPNDYAAVAIWGILARGGLRIPEDISLIGFDDTERVPNSRMENMLTTVRMPLYEIGQEAARLVLRAISEPNQNVQNIVLPTELIVRESTAPPAAERRR